MGGSFGAKLPVGGDEYQLADEIAAKAGVEHVAVGAVGKHGVRVRLVGDHLLRGADNAVGADRIAAILPPP